MNLRIIKRKAFQLQLMPSIEYCRQRMESLIHSLPKNTPWAHSTEKFLFMQQWTHCIMYSSDAPPLRCIMSAPVSVSQILLISKYWWWFLLTTNFKIKYACLDRERAELLYFRGNKYYHNRKLAFSFIRTPCITTTQSSYNPIPFSFICIQQWYFIYA